ncbi:hypothetical protein L9F63_026421, partial [Diploptera punctata]
AFSRHACLPMVSPLAVMHVCQRCDKYEMTAARRARPHKNQPAKLHKEEKRKTKVNMEGKHEDRRRQQLKKKTRTANQKTFE